MKFERYVDSDVMDMLLLGEDYGKMALLLNDRSVLFHAPYGQHHKIRIPTFGRMMAYEPTTCELLVACSGKAGRNSVSKTLGGGEVYRINLEEGRFSAPLNYSAASSVKSAARGGRAAPVVAGNCIAVSPTHALTALGGDDGIIRFWDNRLPPGDAKDDLNINPFCNLDVKSSTAGYGFYEDNGLFQRQNPGEVTSIAFDYSGMQIAAGTKGGNVALYDIRSSKPLHVKEHQYGLPINTIRFHSGSGTIMSCDSKLVKIWRSKPSAIMNNNYQYQNDDPIISSSSSVGSIVANIEGTSNFNNFIVAGDEKDSSGNQSGLVLCAGEQQKIQSFYCPVLGSAPKWCSFLDSITEELEEKDRSRSNDTGTGGDDITGTVDLDGQTGGGIYEDYKFLTRSEIESLGIQHLVGTPLLRGYMHGFFADIGLYNKLRAVANPFEYEEYRKKKVREKMEEKRASRIAPKKVQKAKVNADFADRLGNKVKNDKKKSSQVAKQLLEDDRFGSLFNNPDYEINEDDINFKLRNPSGVQRRQTEDNDMDSDDEDNYYKNGDNEGDFTSTFQKVNNDDEEESWGGNDNNSDDDIDKMESHYEDDDDSDDEDGFNAKVRGENYEEVKAMSRQSNSASRTMKKKILKTKEKKSKKNVMYEADAYDEYNTDSIEIGLGSSSSQILKKRQKEISMSIEDRLRMEKDKTSNFVGETKRMHVKGEGATKEVTYIPKDVQARNERRRQKEQESGFTAQEKSKRQRRGIKELGFKTPFKNQKR
jgi:ribosome biogenesis protein ENP2